MKALLISLASGLLTLGGLHAQTAATTTTTVTTSSGTLHQYTPGSTFVVKETSGPVTYTYGPEVVYATSGGTVLTPEQVQARIRVGLPVRVEYANQGDTRVIRRVLVEDDDDEVEIEVDD
ncbi:hypothetical protein WJU23_13475 [Prosthecobacter sp. SYSU 5D2]|uniref:hypothetical protein n=1 Tax=Prosthecobacter sp. SYSU 5D2 TaxID=3134134 RepID=UPI0031FEC0A0